MKIPELFCFIKKTWLRKQKSGTETSKPWKTQKADPEAAKLQICFFLIFP
jgi:hypothetical protein